MRSGASVGAGSGAATGRDLQLRHAAPASAARAPRPSAWRPRSAGRALSFGSTGSGVFARRLASVLPPPSRFACARMSALVGFAIVLALTSATSSGGPLSVSCFRSNGLKWIVSTTRCTQHRDADRDGEQPVVARRDAAPRGGIDAGGSAPAGAMRAVRRARALPRRRDDAPEHPGSTISGLRRGRRLRARAPAAAARRSAAADAAAVGQRALLGLALRHAFRRRRASRHGGDPGGHGGIVRATVMRDVMAACVDGASRRHPGVAALERRGEQVDRADRDAHRACPAAAAAGRRPASRAAARSNRTRLSRITARRRFGDAFLQQPAQAPVVLHPVLEFGVLRCRSPRNRPAPRRARRRCRRTAARSPATTASSCRWLTRSL